MRSRRSLKVSHTQTSVPCGTLNSLYAIVFQLPVILLTMEGTEKSESSYYSAIGIDTQVTHHVVAINKVAE